MPDIHVTRQIPLTVVLLGALLMTIPFHLQPDNFIVDDGYFYPQIARHIAHGQGSTFNGIMLTNGYHPLWMLVCVVAAWMTSASAPLIQLLGAVQDLLMVGCIAVVVIMGRTARLRGAVLGFVPLVFFGMTLGIWRLLETSLSLSLQIAVLVLVVPVLSGVYNKVGRWRSPLLGLLLGLTMLARLDLIFFVFVVLLYQLLQREGAGPFKRRLGAICLQSVIAGMIVVPYLIWNWLHFHHLVTISGAIKSTFPHPQHMGFASFLYPVIVAIVLNGFLLFRTSRTPFQVLCILTSAATLVHMLYSTCFGEIAPWYVTTGYLCVSLTIIWIADLVIGRWPVTAVLEPVLAGLCFFCLLALAGLRTFSNFTYTHLREGTVSFHGSYVESKRALANTLRETLPAGSRIFIFDAPGAVGFYSGMSLLPADGLVSDFAYNSEVVRNGFAQYATIKHIDYFIAPLVQEGQTYNRLDLKETRSGDAQTMTIEAPLTRMTAGSISLRDADLVFRARQINPDLEKIYPQVGVWRIPHAENGGPQEREIYVR